MKEKVLCKFEKTADSMYLDSLGYDAGSSLTSTG